MTDREEGGREGEKGKREEGREEGRKIIEQ